MSTYDNYSEVHLIALLKDGDQAAFTVLYQRYWDRLFYVGARLSGNLAVAEEIVQDIFLDVWRRREELEIRGELEHYLVVALRYRVLNWQVRQGRQQDYVRYAVGSQTEDQGLEENLRYKELKVWLEKLVSRLPEKCQIAYRLREEGFSHREIAEKMQVSPRTVDNHIGRALRLLRAGLSELFSLFLSLLWVFVLVA